MTAIQRGENMDISVMISALVSHLTVMNVILFVLILAQEIIANIPSIKSNSLGQMILSSLKDILTKFWSQKTSS